MRCGTFKRLQSTCFLKSMKKDDGTPVNDFRGGGEYCWRYIASTKWYGNSGLSCEVKHQELPLEELFFRWLVNVRLRILALLVEFLLLGWRMRVFDHLAGNYPEFAWRLTLLQKHYWWFMRWRRFFVKVPGGWGGCKGELRCVLEIWE